MGEDLLCGNLYASMDGVTTRLGDDWRSTVEVDTMSPDAYVKETHRLMALNQGCMSFDINKENLSFLNELCNPMNPPDTFTYEYDVPIMIQARCHKKKRINKKWLKRYGMKYDTVKRRVEARVISWDTSSGEVEFENTKNAEYLLRQNQMRKNLKMEWL